MPSSLNHWVYLMLPHALRLLGILVIALAVNRLLRAASKLIIKTATAQTRQSQLREQQTRTLAGIIYGTASKVVWAVALLMALHEFMDVTPAVALAGLASLAFGLGAWDLEGAVVTDIDVVLEDHLIVDQHWLYCGTN